MDPKAPIPSSLLSTNGLSSLIVLLLILSSLLILNFANLFEPLYFLPFAFVSSPPPPSSLSAAHNCDHTNGTWVWDETHNAGSYTEDCPFLDPGFQCVRNGRNDTGFLHWRWQPHGCNLPRFDGRDMLERSRGKRIVFVGDSLGRNQWESFLCMLWTAVSNKSTVYEANGNPISKHKGFLVMRFAEFNLTVEYYRCPYLIVVGRPPPDSPKKVRMALRLDTPQWMSKRWRGADVIMFNSGHWWNIEKTRKMGHYFQVGKHLNMTMGIKDAFRKSIETIRDWSLENFQLDKSIVIFRSYGPTHWRNGSWDTGGYCDHWSEPEHDATMARPDHWYNQVIAEALQGTGAHFLNITLMTELRKDGHVSRHREPGTPPDGAQDCSHWCLPGVPDAWNELFYNYLLSVGYGATST